MKHGKITADLAVGLGSQLAYKLLGFVVLALLARQLTQDDYGRLMFALSLCLVTVLVTDLGASQDLVRQVATSPHRARRYVALVLAARLPMTVAYLVALNVWVALTKPDVALITAPIAFYAVCKDLDRTFASLFLGLHRLMDTIITYGSGMLLLACGVALGVALDRSLPWMVSCYVVSGMALLAISVHLAWTRVGRIPLRCRPRLIPRVFGQSLSLFGLTVMSSVHFSADTLMLGYLQSYKEVARYEAAAKLLEASQFVVRPMTMILLPICAELAAASEWQRLLRLLRKMLLGTVAVGLATCAVVAVLAGWIVRVVYTQAYDDSANVLRVLFLSVPGLYVATVGTFLAASVHSERRALVALVSGVVLNAALNAWAIPKWGAMGAAWVTVVSQSVIAVWLAVEAVYMLRQHRRLDEEDAARFEQAVGVQNE